jgi:hypothetical protein
VENGLADPMTLEDKEERSEAAFRRALRQGDEAAAHKQYLEVLVHWMNAKKELAAMDIHCGARYLPLLANRVIGLNNMIVRQGFVSELSHRDRTVILPSEKLWKLGLHRDAIKRIERDIQSALKEMNDSTNLNLHFPADQIKRAIIQLIEYGQKKLAQRWFSKISKQSKHWTPIHGFSSAAVIRNMAIVVAKLEGPDEARKLLDLAMRDSKGERWRDMKHGAVRETIELYDELGLNREAIELASTLRSQAERRRILAPILARSQRWKELREVLKAVDSPKEAAEICWRIKFELTDG